MNPIFVASDNIISPLGFTTPENMEALIKGITGITLHENAGLSPDPFWASMMQEGKLTERFSAYANPGSYTRLEQMIICSMKDALSRCNLDVNGERTLLIVSSTKGNIDLLDHAAGSRFENNRVYLWYAAGIIQRFFGLKNTPLVVSNACISGVLALIIGSRLIRWGKYDHIIIAGADLVTEFVLSGFNSFKSICPGPCKPFDKDRQGLSLGEAAGTIVLTTNREMTPDSCGISVGSGFSSNDANHISGPSRTGEGLYIAIRRTLEKADKAVDFISAHGTATPYNDEMESIAISRADLQQVPVNSLKGYWGHTLGAAGIIESVASAFSLRENTLLNTLGYSSSGVSQPINIISKTTQADLNSCLKIASGFGGCNASLLFQKI
ncbi:MAG: beta-ketoacyl synthase N-terminal-like domain-containing protein [Bacteroidales bacterium]